MNKILLIAIVFAGLGGIQCARAGGQIKFPQGDAAWSVTFEEPPGKEDSSSTKKTTLASGSEATKTPAPTKEKQKRVPVHVDIVRMGNLRRDRIMWSDQSVTEEWWTINPSFVVFQDAPDGPVLISRSGNMGDHRYDDSIFDWVNETTFKGIQSYRTKKCRYYEMRFIDPITQEIEKRYAWINDETSRPVAWSDGGMHVVFSYDATLPKEPLVLPEKFQEKIKHIMSFSMRQKSPNVDSH